MRNKNFILHFHQFAAFVVQGSQKRLNEWYILVAIVLILYIVYVLMHNSFSFHIKLKLIGTYSIKSISTDDINDKYDI